jgi:plastocyanin
MSRPLAIVPVALAALVAACGGSYTSPTQTGGTGNPPAQTATVSATASNAFTPGNVTLAVGGTVTFEFGAVGHNVYFDNSTAGAPSDIPGVNANMTATRTFSTPGTYEYTCHIHPGMKGSVVVGSSNAPPVTGGGYGY